jgi:translation initiation factor 2 subunit 3
MSTNIPSELNPLTPCVISKQATINIGTIGHVAHGKSTVVRSLSGVSTIKFKKEKERNITIKLGYANCKIYKLVDSQSDSAPPTISSSSPSSTPSLVPKYLSKPSSFPDEIFSTPSGYQYKLERHISFVDCPGHDTYMATMMSGAAVMDGALLLVAGNEPCPQPQTAEHLAAVEIMNLQHLIVLQNKVELISENQAVLQHADLVKFLAGSIASTAPIVPISAINNLNLDIVCEYICTQIPVPVRDISSSVRMIVIRSFDVNKPGSDIEDLQGGVAGGSILRGVLKMDQTISIRPGITKKSASLKGSRFRFTPLITKVTALRAESNNLEFAIPGGLIAVGTNLDPQLTKSDFLVGQVIMDVDDEMSVFETITVKYNLLRRLLGVKVGASETGKEKGVKIEKLKKGELLKVNISSVQVGANVIEVDSDSVVLELSKPVCIDVGGKIAISRKHEMHWRLIGYGEITGGKESLIE